MAVSASGVGSRARTSNRHSASLMPRRLIKKLAHPRPRAPPRVVLQPLWRSPHRFAPLVAEPSLHYRGVWRWRRVSFIPLPVHLVLVVLLAIWWRLNVAVAIAGSYFVNPFTMVPVYFTPIASERWLLRYRPHHLEVSLQLELARAWPRPGLEAVSARLSGVRRHCRPRRPLCPRVHLACGDDAPLPYPPTAPAASSPPRAPALGSFRALGDAGGDPAGLSAATALVAAGLSVPALSSSTRSMRAASRGSCVTTTRLVPNSRLSSSISANTCSALRPSRLPVGSSASTSFGETTSARATAVRWRSPPESSWGR